jgi:hypothetical protein
MFEAVRYVQNSFAIALPRQHGIRRKANDFEDFLQANLEGHYQQPMLIPVPDEMDPEIPRLIFGSRHGFSQIVVSRIGLSLNVTYSPDWQLDVSKGRQYLLERAPVLFDLFSILDNIKPFFSGLTTRVRLPVNADDETILRYLYKFVAEALQAADIHDVTVKIASFYNQMLYSNMTAQYYRTWKMEKATTDLQRLSRQCVSERGIEITGDFNDRYPFNERADYFSSPKIVSELLTGGFAEIHRLIDNLQEISP